MLADLLALVAVLLLLGLVYVKLSKHPLDPVALFCYLFAFFYVFRNVAIALRLDGPYPDNLFAPAQTSHLVLEGSLVLACFLSAFVFGYLVHQPFGEIYARLVPVAWRTPLARKQFRLLVFLTIVSTLISLALLARYGGVAGVIRAGKVTKELSGAYLLRIFPAVGGVVASSFALTVWRERRRTGSSHRFLSLIAVGSALLNAGYVMLWGSRQVAAVVIIIFLTGQWMVRREATAAGIRRGRPQWIKLVALAGILLVAVVGLRLVRDKLAIGQVSRSIQGQSDLRKVSVATNSTYFDATLLALRD